MRINCEILDLRAFLAVLDHGSFHKAAELLHISQPALSRRIKGLERVLGGSLFERSTRRVSPTRIGTDLEPLARRLVDDFDGGVARVGYFGDRQLGQVAIASVPTTACFLLPAVLDEFRARYPDIRLRIMDVTAKDGLEYVARGEAEFGINFLGASRPEFRFTPLVDDEFVVACRLDHPFASRKTVRWCELVDWPLIVSQTSGNRAVIDQALSKSNIMFNWAYEVHHLSTSFGLVEAGLGLSVLPRLATPKRGHPRIAAIPLRQPLVTRTIGIVERRHRSLAPAAEFIRTLLVAKLRQEHPTRTHRPARSLEILKRPTLASTP
jgi:DNA-binding transcriptional LysR family regulator